MRVKGGSDTLVAWHPSHWHGTSLQNYPPTTQVIPEVIQCGLSIVTPKRLTSLWKKYVAEQLTLEQMRAEWAMGSDSEEED